jgi:hypothetical protein
MRLPEVPSIIRRRTFAKKVRKEPQNRSPVTPDGFFIGSSRASSGGRSCGKEDLFNIPDKWNGNEPGGD